MATPISAAIFGAWAWRLLLVKSCILHCRRATRTAFCILGEDQIRLQIAGIGPPEVFPGLVRIARHVVAGRALASSWRDASLKLDAQLRACHRVRGVAHAKEYPENMMVNTLPSKTKDTLCISYSRRFLPVPSILAAARSASSWSSSLLFYCFAANRWAVPPKT